MGLDASVMCNCHRLGKATSCPFPDDFYVDEDGFPAIRLKEDEVDKSDEFDEWLATCCAHPYMDYVTVHIPSWKGYRSLVEALEAIGSEQFPTLIAELPEANEGVTTATASALALKELIVFQSMDDISRTFLVNTETGTVISSTTAGDDRLLSVDAHTGLRPGFDTNGFYISDTWELNRELFRAKRVEQRRIESKELDVPDEYEFTDLDSGQKFVSTTPLRIFVRGEAGLKQDYPARIHVEKRVVDASYFKSIIEPLKTVFEASVEMDNPVRWG